MLYIYIYIRCVGLVCVFLLLVDWGVDHVRVDVSKEQHIQLALAIQTVIIVVIIMVVIRVIVVIMVLVVLVIVIISNRLERVYSSAPGLDGFWLLATWMYRWVVCFGS